MKPHRSLLRLLAWIVLGLHATPVPAADSAPVTLDSLLAEMTDPFAVTRMPDPPYRSLQASSYNRDSVRRDQPGWFADSDGVGFIRQENRGGRTEWVVLEHQGPGCLTKNWTPFFHYDLADHTGPNLRIYLDGAEDPIIDEPFIPLLTGKGSVAAGPFAAFTARAGNLYLPIPFARGCRVAFSARPFYHILNYRAYPAGTPVETLRREQLERSGPQLASAARRLLEAAAAPPQRAQVQTGRIAPRQSLRLTERGGPAALSELVVGLADARSRPSALRTTVLVLRFDGRPTAWCPLGDFFSNTDAIHPFHTWQRTVTADGVFTCRWPMPFARSARVELLNLGPEPVEARIETRTARATWGPDSLHFHATWRPDDVIPGTPFQDWNFVDIQGRGVYVGDSWTVLNPQRNTWWGEGDEKIYVDEAWDAGFPTHFGTGTEDYYGWAGGVLPDRRDEFSQPFLANVRVGGLDGHTEGFNICTRTRALDAIPFERRLRMDMESSFGTDIRNPWNLLGYSAVTFWYGAPGARHNRPPQPAAAASPPLQLDALRARSDTLRTR